MTIARPSRRRAGIVVGLLAVALPLSACGSTDLKPVADRGPAVDKALHQRLPDDVRKRGTVVVGTDASYAPMSSYGADGRTIVGMEADLAAAIGDVLGVKVTMRDVRFEKLSRQVNDGTLDIALSAMTDTPERARRVDFVDYFRAGTAILVQRGNPHRIRTLGDLCGRRVAIESGTVQVDLLARQQSLCGDRPAEPLYFTTNTDALLRLRTGRADAVLTDLPPAALLAHGRRSRQFYELASSKQYEPGYYGLVVRKHDPRMLAVMTGAFSRLLADGEYRRILRRWDLQTGAVGTAMVNSGR